jgi:hypothetical protein
MARGHTQNNGEGVLVDTIHYESAGVMLTDKAAEALSDEIDPAGDIKVGQVKIPVEVRLRKEFKAGGGTNRAVERLQFSLVCRKPHVVLRGSDIETLRRAMWAELDRSTDIQWEPYLLITIEPATGYGDGVSEGLRLEERTVWKGTTQDGYEMLREHSHDRFGIGWTYRPWPGTFTDKRGRVTACIPASKANEDAMEEFRGRIRALRAKLQDLVRPDEIVATLANLSGIPMLPPALPRDKGLQDGRD